MKAKASQNSRILRYLMKGKSLEPLQALKLFDTWSLSSRISELVNKEGFPIVTTMVTRKKKRFAKYTLEHQATLGI